ncbi:hypothetical protein [Bacillus sp. 1P02SD]|uniref:hypothetical protein n=1 Tax=Bacillus sp. 1P02SD TaxID=3132264 RepID=UPI0039A0010E
MLLKFAYQDFLGDRRFKNTTKQNVSKPNTASVEDNAWILCKSCNIAKGTKIIIEVIKEVPSQILGPMLLQQYAKRIVEGLFEKVTITIGFCCFHVVCSS